MDQNDLVAQMQAVLKANDMGEYTVPAQGIYPHQWLWDSCFIAIGLRHVDLERAKTEILSLLKGQWKNGMLPHMILFSTKRHVKDGNIWRSWVNPYSPDHLATSGITQPPMLAEAVLRVGEKMKLAERRTWYKSVYSALLAYHLWIYLDRDPHQEGLALLIHPWETGLDNTPPWMSELKDHMLPFWIRLIQGLHLQPLINLLRRDTHLRHIPAGERMDLIEALALFHMQRRLRRKGYDTERAVTHSLLIIEDLAFNSILIRANSCLKTIAKTIGYELPVDLFNRMSKTEEALEQFWDEYSAQYFSRNFITHKFIKEPSIATLLPLYAGSVTPERAAQLVKMLKDEKLFWPAFPVPSVPLNSNWFNPHAYWQGPSWVSTNWLIIDGLRRLGFNNDAEELTTKTIAMVEQYGPNEYFSPLDGSPSGASNFSWTAALIIDLLNA